MLVNAFRNGYTSTHEQYAGIDIFPYREDNRANLIKSYLTQRDINGNNVDFYFHIKGI